MVHKRMAATFRRHRTSLSAGAHMYMSSLLLTACAVLLCPAGLTKMVSKLSKEGAYKKGLEVRRHNKAAVLRGIKQSPAAGARACSYCNSFRPGTLSNGEKHCQPCAFEHLPSLAAAGAWGTADSVLDTKPFSTSLLQVYHTLIHMGIMPDTAITNSAISACDKGEAGTRPEQHRWRSAEVDTSAHHKHLQLNMWDELPRPAEVEFIASTETSPS